MTETIIDLRNVHFSEAETTLASFGGLTASVWRYRGGVAALRLANDMGHIIVLPFQGQQIWDARFLGRTLTMKSIFSEPVQTSDYLSTYGAFFIHCGATAMGNPGPADHHPLHGELPNANYQDASLVTGIDSDGPFLGMTGFYRHAVAFQHHYVARPMIKLHTGSSRIRANLQIQNLKHSPMELMYLAHVNFRPADYARLIDTVPDDPCSVRLRLNPPPGFLAMEQHRQLLDALRANPVLHRAIGAEGMTESAIDPEIVFAMDCRSDVSGWAHAMQRHADGTADFISHRPDELPCAVRWMTRNGDLDALGLMLPATAEADGHAAEKAKGHIRMIPPRGFFTCSLEFGALDDDAAAALVQVIDGVMGR